MANIPIFIPHVGCKNDCAFCNQRSITGNTAPPSFEEADRIIKEHLQTIKEKPQVAFFGGSFTGIEPHLMEGYLRIAYKHLEKGEISGIRLSTRPDYITRDILDVLKSYGVTNIELGAQSMDNDVLLASRRGHTKEDVEKASCLINEYGFILGLQMMVGLPLDNYEKSIATAREFVRLGAKETRIYPTVIIKNTRLAEMYENGEYVPVESEEAIDTAADCYSIFFENNVKVLRIGLPASETLKEDVVGGFYHEALGEKVYSRVIRRKAQRENKGEICYNRRFLSKVVGQKRENMPYLGKFKLSEDNSLEGVMVNGKYVLTI